MTHNIYSGTATQPIAAYPTVNGGNVTITAGTTTSWNSGNTIVVGGMTTDGYMNFAAQETKTITEEIKPWKRLWCSIFGHKEVKPQNSVSIYVMDNDGNRYQKDFKCCSRCGLYEKYSIERAVPLTENEQIIKDIIT